MKLFKIFVRSKSGKYEGYMYAQSNSTLEAKRLLKYKFRWIGTFGTCDEIEYVSNNNIIK
jgi:hypothetical protein